MMVVRRREGTWEHRAFRDLPSLLGPDSFLVLNSTRVFPARLRMHRPGRQEEIEVLLVREVARGKWLSLMKPGRKATSGQLLQAPDLSATVLEVRKDGSRLIRFECDQEVMTLLEALGEPPLPPYIKRPRAGKHTEDRIRYQTVYAKQIGSVAAPTAGLHFTEQTFKDLQVRGVPICEILLHVGYGTFQPIRCTDAIEKHIIEPEFYEVTKTAAEFIRQRKAEGRSLLAVGTTTTRVLESLARSGEGDITGSSGFCDLYIYPGFEFRVVDKLLTNFHLPRSSLFLMVSAFAGRELMIECYREAVARNYRFFSYGDCMLIL